MIEIFEFDHVSIEELAHETITVTDADGKQRTVSQLNRKKLMELHRKRAADGERVMEPFRKWLIAYHGIIARDAQSLAAMLWIALWETKNKPWEYYERTDISVVRRNKVKRAINLFAESILRDKKSTQAARKWAHEALAHDRIISMKKKSVQKQRAAETRAKTAWIGKREDTPPRRYLTAEDDRRVFEELEKWNEARGARWPYAYPLFRLMLFLGFGPRSEAMMRMGRVWMKMGLESREKPPTFRVLGEKRRTRIIPVDLVRKELETLVNWPAPWGIVADLIAADRDNYEDRPRIACSRVNVVWRDFVTQADPEVAELLKNHFVLRETAIHRVWSAYHRVPVVSGMFGMALSAVQSRPYIRDELAV